MKIAAADIRENLLGNNGKSNRRYMQNTPMCRCNRRCAAHLQEPGTRVPSGRADMPGNRDYLCTTSTQNDLCIRGPRATEREWDCRRGQDKLRP